VYKRQVLRFVEMHITFLFHSKACVVGSNPAFPPKNTRLQDGYFLLYLLYQIKDKK